MSAGRPVARHLDFALLLAVLVLAWQGVHELTGSLAMPSPWSTALAVVELMRSDSFWRHAAATAAALGSALAIAAVAGLALGTWLGANRLAGAVGEPYLIAVYSLPKVALYPVILLVFGLGFDAKVAFGALHGIMPIAIFTMAGIRNIEPVLLKSARTMGLGPLATARRVILPAALPEVVSGLRLGLSMTFLGTLIGEMFAARDGLGQILFRSIALIDARTILALTVVMFTVAIALNLALLRIERRARGRVH